MSGKLIALIYFYIVSAGALVLLVIGVFNVVNYVINATQYDKYPLGYYSTNCDYLPESVVKPLAPGIVATASAQDQQQQKSLCEQNLELTRKDKKVQDLKNAVTFPAVGLILFLIHFPIARKMTKGSN